MYGDDQYSDSVRLKTEIICYTMSVFPWLCNEEDGPSRRFSKPLHPKYAQIATF